MRRVVAALVLALLTAGARADVPTIGWEDAGQHVGEEVNVEGRVLGLHCSQLSCLLAFEPTFNKFTAVIQAARFGDFPKAEEIEKRFTGKRVRVHGTVRMNDGKPEIVLESPQDLALADADKEKERADALRMREAQTEILERLGDVLARIEELTERMAATQERMEEVLARMEQRAAELAAASQPPPGPVGGGYGEAQPRPRYEALRSVKRGMSRDDVRRLVGDPMYVEQSPNGAELWFYAYGRSVSFNSRGRAEAVNGF
ncbi:MAG TPA: outer membrane protein assembly factor BamE [Candidatus Binatia bacterium]|jgi:hypothetical protein|nr:outer membrane protein assembly factor BamE [Candidatus Binatia bacterium]